MVAIKLVLFGVSTLGTFELIRKASAEKVDVYFLPSLAIAIQVTLLFFAGILNLLPEMTMVLYLVGFAGLAVSIYQNKNPEFLKKYLNEGYILLLLIMGVMAISVKGKLFSHYDNFSHWAIVVRHMLEVNHYPNFESSLIMFQDYPLGSSTYIYYFAKLINSSESMQMLAQIYMITAALLPVFSFIKKSNIAFDVFFVFLTNFIFTYNVTVGNLLVDTLLPVVGICGVLFAIKYCDEACGWLEFWLSSCYMVQLMQIKNSGIFFVLLIIAFSLKYVWNSGYRLSGILSLLFPFITLVIWQKHCEYVFSSAATSKHAMTVENYKSVFGDKTIEDVKNISISFIKFIATYKDFWMMLAIAVVSGCLIWFFNKEYLSLYKNCFLISAIVYVAYQLGTLGMYLFSMPTAEALILGSKERYTKTILIAMILAFAVVVLIAASDNVAEKKVGYISSATLTVGIILFSYLSLGSFLIAPNTVNVNRERTWLEHTKEQYDVPMYESYCMLIPTDDAGYSYYLQRYVFQSTDVSGKVVGNRNDLNDISAKYVFVYDKHNKYIRSWIRRNYPEQFGNSVIIQTEE